MPGTSQSACLGPLRKKREAWKGYLIAMPEIGAMELAEMTKGLDDSKKMIFNQQYQSEKKDSGTGVILAIFGFDRFWLGDIGLGFLKYLTGGGCGIWWLIDLFTIKGRCDDYNRRKATELLEAMSLVH